MKFLKPKKLTRKQIETARAEQDIRLDKLTASAEQSKFDLDSIALHTKEIAEDITLKLRNDLMDKMRQIEITSSIITDALFVCEEDGSIKFMNHIGEALLQRSLTPGQRVSIKDHVQYSEDSDYWNALMSDPAKAKIVRGDGASLFCSLNVARLEKTEGAAEYIVLLHLLLDAETVENAPIMNKGTLLVSEGMITAANDEVERVLGYERGELLGSPFLTIVAPTESAFVKQQLSSHDMETTFDSVLLSKRNTQLFCKMAVSFVTMDGKFSAVITIENIGHDVMDRKVDVLRVFGEDFFFRSSTFAADSDDMVMYLTPDLKIKYVNEPMRRRLVCRNRDITNVALEEVLSMTEYKIAVLHLQSLSQGDNERTISMHLKNTNAGSFQEWTDRAFYDEKGVLVEYRRSGSFRS